MRACARACVYAQRTEVENVTRWGYEVCVHGRESARVLGEENVLAASPFNDLTYSGATALEREGERKKERKEKKKKYAT